MRRAIDIERKLEARSWKIGVGRLEERPYLSTVIPNPENSCERSVTREQHGEETGKNFTPRFGLTPYNGACSLNCPPTGRGTSGAGGFEEGPVELGGYSCDFTSIVTTSLPRESFAWLSIMTQTADGDRKIADCRLRLPGDDSNSSVGTKNCPGTAQVARWEQKAARGRVRMVGEHEKWFGDGSNRPGMGQPCRGNSKYGGFRDCL
jgi:hypothetical protein